MIRFEEVDDVPEVLSHHSHNYIPSYYVSLDKLKGETLLVALMSLVTMWEKLKM